MGVVSGSIRLAIAPDVPAGAIFGVDVNFRLLIDIASCVSARRFDERLLGTRRVEAAVV